MKYLNKRLIGLGVVLATGAAALAQTAPPTTEEAKPPTTEEAKPANTLNVHGLFGVDFPTHYISRGLDLEDQGFIAQPYIELDFTLQEGDGFISKTVAFGGIWSSLHSQHTDQGLASGTPGVSATDVWYENDWYFGVAFDMAKNFNLNLSYWEFTSPNDGFGTSKNLQAKLSYNDVDAWGGKGFALKPYGIVFIETDGKAGSGSDEGVYIELGIEPTVYSFNADSAYPVAISVPVKVGLGFSDFYEDDETLGFVSAGLKLSVPLAFIPSSYGSWSAYTSVTYYFYGDGVDDFNKLAGDGDDDIVAAFGIAMTF